MLVYDGLKVRRSQFPELPSMQGLENVISSIVRCYAAFGNLFIVFSGPFGKDIRECHIVSLGQVPACEAFQSLQGIRLALLIPNDHFVFCGSPGAL